MSSAPLVLAANPGLVRSVPERDLRCSRVLRQPWKRAVGGAADRRDESNGAGAQAVRREPYLGSISQALRQSAGSLHATIPVGCARPAVEAEGAAGSVSRRAAEATSSSSSSSSSSIINGRLLQRASESVRTCKQAIANAFAPIEPVINSPHEACQRVAELQPRVQGRREPQRRTSRRAVDVAFVLDEDSCTANGLQ